MRPGPEIIAGWYRGLSRLGRSVIWLNAGALGLLLFTAIASYVFLRWGGLLSQFPLRDQWRAWWIYLPYWNETPKVHFMLQVSGLVGLAPFALAAYGIWRRPALSYSLLRPSAGPARLVRGVSDNHGHADWMPLQQARALFPGPHPGYGGVVVGEAYRVDQDSVAGRQFDPEDKRSWGRGGTASLLIDPCTTGPTHSLLFAGSGGFKTTTAVSTLLHWIGSAVVLDPSCELGPMLTRARGMMGQAVRQLTLDDPECGFNVLDWIDIGSPMAETHVRSVVWWLAGGESAGTGRQDETAAFFKARGNALIACLLAHMLWSDRLPAKEKNLRNLRRMLATPEPDMRHALRAIHRTSKSSMARDYAGTLMGLVAETFSGVYANADEDSSWLANPAFAALVSGSRFRTADILTGSVTVFLQIPLMALMHSPAVARVILGALLNAVYEADARTQGRVLFLLDEVARLGTMRMIEDARDLGRKYGITLQLLYQRGAAREAMGAGGQARLVRWRVVARLRGAAGPGDRQGAVRVRVRRLRRPGRLGRHQ